MWSSAPCPWYVSVSVVLSDRAYCLQSLGSGQLSTLVTEIRLAFCFSGLPNKKGGGGLPDHPPPLLHPLLPPFSFIRRGEDFLDRWPYSSWSQICLDCLGKLARQHELIWYHAILWRTAMNLNPCGMQPDLVSNSIYFLSNIWDAGWGGFSHLGLLHRLHCVRQA